MRHNQSLLLRLILIGLPIYAYAQSGIIDPSRRVDWSQAGIPGGIPVRSTVCTTLNPGATSAQINSAIANCPSGQVVFLNAGTYNLSAGIDIRNARNVTLRGAGPDKTFLVFNGGVNCQGLGTHVCIFNGNGIYTQSPGNTASWIGGHQKGSSSIVVSNKADMQIGTVLILDQLDDSNTDTNAIWVCQKAGVCSTEGPSGSGRTNRSQQQLVKVTSISGGACPCTIGISPSIYMPNWRTSQSPELWYSSSLPISGIGIEDLSMDHTPDEATGVLFYNASESWIKNVRSITPGRNHVWLYQSVRIAVRDSYFYGTQNAASQSYGIETFQTSDDLIENNIFQHITSPLSVNGSASGLVYAYNYSTDDHYYSPGWMMAAVWLHSSGVDHLLIEGNEGAGFIGDAVHGTHHFVTNFRNHWLGWEPSKTQQTVPIHLYSYSRYMNVVGNVLGRSGYHTNYENNAPSGTDCDVSIYRLGWSSHCYQGGVPNDSRVKTTLLRWGNYDVVTNGVRWNASEIPTSIGQFANTVPGNQNLPASFYLPTKPSWWGSTPWPAIGPDVAGGSGPAGHAYDIPAKGCYNSSPIDSKYGGANVRLFRGTSCYGQTSGSAPAPPTNLRAVVQ